MTATSSNIKSNLSCDPKIINLYDSQASFLGIDFIVDVIMSHPRFEERIKEYMEISIYSDYLKLLSGSTAGEDNPFDSIYLADLKPDTITDNTRKSLLSISKQLEDRSSNLFFDDGLDD